MKEMDLFGEVEKSNAADDTNAKSVAVFNTITHENTYYDSIAKSLFEDPEVLAGYVKRGVPGFEDMNIAEIKSRINTTRDSDAPLLQLELTDDFSKKQY